MAERELTRKQLEVFELECAEMGTMTIARRLMLTRSAVRDRLHSAHTKLERAGVRQDANGRYYIEEAA